MRTETKQINKLIKINNIIESGEMKFGEKEKGKRKTRVKEFKVSFKIVYYQY